MKLVKRIISFGILFNLYACQVNKYLPKDSKIYGGSKIKIYQPKDVKDAQDLSEKIEELLLPKENTKVGLPLTNVKYPYKVAFYFKLKADKKKRAKIFNRFIEKPVYFSEDQLKRNEKIIHDFLKTKGYFDAKVNSIGNTNRIIRNAKYYVYTGHRYKIDTVMTNAGFVSRFDRDLGTALRSMKFGEYFDLETIKTERLKVENTLRQKGYFGFKPDMIEITADTIGRKRSMSINLQPKEIIEEAAQKQYQINDVFVYVDQKPVINTGEESDFFRGLILEDKNKKYNSGLFFDAIAFRPGALYDNTLSGISNNRLIGLNNFKLVTSSFQVVNRLDSTLLDTYYYLQSQKSKSFRAEANAITRSSGLAGSQLSFSWLNINTFKRAEQFKIAAKFGLELQLGGKTNNEYRDNYRIGVDASLLMPRFVAPWVKIDPEISKVLPKTQLILGWESFIKKDLYNLNSVKTGLQYSWTRGRGIEHVLKPFSFNFIKSSNLSSVFIDEIFSDPKLLVILENQLVTSANYEINILPKTKKNRTVSYTGSIDFAGSLLGVFDQIRNNESKKGKIFGEYFSQFVRLENDYRFKFNFTKKTNLANRIFVGVGVPYGNSLQVPFINQFYVGGNNSLRAFRARGVGPGVYKRTNSISELFLGNNTGDIKLEFNTEIRHKFNGFFGTALFLDAGNVWMTKDPYIYGKEALFSKGFYKQLALGSGVGFRFDFGFIIARLDLGIPLFKPWEDTNAKWVKFDPLKKSWRKDNLIWNIAIGLPF